MVEDWPDGRSHLTHLNYQGIRAILTTKISKDFAAS